MSISTFKGATVGTATVDSHESFTVVSGGVRGTEKRVAAWQKKHLSHLSQQLDLGVGELSLQESDWWDKEVPAIAKWCISSRRRIILDNVNNAENANLTALSWQARCMRLRAESPVLHSPPEGSTCTPKFTLSRTYPTYSRQGMAFQRPST
jgi:hypothetical protein